MLSYLISFAISVGLAYLANKNYKNKTKFYIFSLLSIMIVALLAGLRDYSVGYDVNNYISVHWTLARSSASFTSYCKAIGTNEYLFLLILFFFGKVTSDFHFVLAFLHLIIIACIYFGAFKHRKIINPCFLLFLFYFLFFNDSLNIIRQYVAMSIVFAGFILLENNKLVKFSLVILIASLFHKVALISFVYVLLRIIFFNKNCKLRPNFEIKQFFIIVLCTLVVVLGHKILTFMLNSGLLSSKYALYLTSESVSSANLKSILLAIEIFILFTFFEKSKADLKFYRLNAVIYLIVLQLTRVIFFGSRIALFFSLMNLFPLCMASKCCISKYDVKILNASLVIVVIMYWLFLYILNNSGNTYPYLFYFQ